jgi:hypothetical protein
VHFWVWLEKYVCLNTFISKFIDDDKFSNHHGPMRRHGPAAAGMQLRGGWLLLLENNYEFQ